MLKMTCKNRVKMMLLSELEKREIHWKRLKRICRREEIRSELGVVLFAVDLLQEMQENDPIN